jgi:hypothetical protein
VTLSTWGPIATMPAPRLLAILITLIVIVIAATTLLSGDAWLLIPAAILLVLLTAYAGFHRMLRVRLDHRHHDQPDAAMSDNGDAVPAAHLIPDQETPLGATSETHDRISPHDLPKGNPVRPAVVEAAGGEDGTASSADVKAVLEDDS